MLYYITHMITMNLCIYLINKLNMSDIEYHNYNMILYFSHIIKHMLYINYICHILYKLITYICNIIHII